MFLPLLVLIDDTRQFFNFPSSPPRSRWKGWRYQNLAISSQPPFPRFFTFFWLHPTLSFSHTFLFTTPSTPTPPQLPSTFLRLRHRQLTFHSRPSSYRIQFVRDFPPFAFSLTPFPHVPLESSIVNSHPSSSVEREELHTLSTPPFIYVPSPPSSNCTFFLRGILFLKLGLETRAFFFLSYPLYNPTFCVILKSLSFV